MKASASQFVNIRGLRYHVRSWGDPAAPKLFMLHGWMDVGASFQFLVDALQRDWHVLAPDWRGFGQSEWCADGYWFADYVADLDALLDLYTPAEPARLVGHSLGGNVVMHYAGVRPQRVSRVVSLEGFGIPVEATERAPEKLINWLDALREPPEFRPYPNLAAVANRLQKSNPRLARDRAEFLAAHWARVQPDASAQLASDPRHKLPTPTVYRMEEVFCVWQRIAAPVLWVAATESTIPKWLNAHPEGEAATDDLAGVRARLARVARGELVTIADAGHMVHLEAPDQVAAAIEPFLAA